jgi:hypothetical protein
VTASQVLTVVGGVIQVVGAVVAMVGLAKTHDEFAEKSLRTLAIERANNVGDHVRAFGWRLLRRPPRRVVGAGVAFGGAGSFTGRGRIGFPPLPGTLAEDIAALERRTQQLLDGLSETQERLVDRVAEIRGELQAMRDELAVADEGLEELVRRAAIGGVLLEAVGLFLVVLGLALQGVGAAIG